MNIKLTNIRSLKAKEYNLEKQTTILIGANGCGKSTIIEALYFCCFFKSSRTSITKEMVTYEEEYANITTSFKDESIEVNFYKGKVGLLHNLNEVKAKNILNQFDVILIEPELIEIINKGPALRRNFINRNLVQVDKDFLDLQIKYNNLTKTRNKFLKFNDYDKDYHLTVNQMADQINEQIVSQKKRYIQRLEDTTNKILKWITDSKEEIKLVYEQLVVDKDSRLLREQKYKSSLFGNHLDDMLILLNGKSLKKFGSSGQRRTVAISLMLGHMNIMHIDKGTYPLVLIDDIHAEIDKNRQEKLHSLLQNKTNVIIATPDISNINTKILEDPNTQVISMD